MMGWWEKQTEQGCMMFISCLAIVLEILSIQRYADASFLPSFSHHGHPMKPHFLGPPIHGPPMILGPPPMYGPPIHGPFHMPSPHLLDPPGPMFPPELMHERFHPRKYLPPHKYVQPISPKVLRPFPHPKRLLPIMKPLSHKKLYKKPRRVLLIKRQNNINFPKVHNPYGYERKLRRLRPFNRERYLAGYESVPRSRYDNNYYRSNSNVPNIPGQRQHSPDRSALNGGSLDYIASGGDVYNNNNNIKSINTRNNENLPRLREVIDSGKRRQIKRNSVRTRNVGGSVKRQSIKRRGQKNNAKGLSGKTIDFSKSTVISSNKNIGTESLSSNLLDKSNTGTHSEQLSIRKESMRSRKNISHISSVTTPIGKKPKNSRPNLKADVNSRPGTGSKHDAGLGGSLIDLSHIGESTGANDPNQTVKLGAGASSLVSAGAGRLGSAVPAAAASAAATDVNANTFANAATAASNLNGNAINSASNLGGVSSSHDLVIIDSSANKRNTLADVAAKAIPEAFNAQGGVVDLTATSGVVSGANLNNLGPNVDVLTLDKNAFAKLEKALQSGQTVDAQLLDSILGNVGSTGALNGGSTSSALSSGNADVGIANAATPEIYFLDTAQAQHLTEFAGFSGNGGASQLAESHTASSTSTSSKTSHSLQKSSSTSSSTHSGVDIPHAGKVLPAGHGHTMPGRRGHGHTVPGGHSHDIVGVVGKPVGHITVGANTDIRGLFSLPTGNNLSNIPASVSSIPKSINQRMSGGHQPTGQGPHHQNSSTSMTSGPGHTMSHGHHNSGHTTHCTIMAVLGMLLLYRHKVKE